MKQKLELFSLSLGFYLVDGRLNLFRSDTWHNFRKVSLSDAAEANLATAVAMAS